MTNEGSIKGVILAAGYGTRMATLTAVVPKPLLPIVNVPTLERILHALRAAGITEVLMITGYRAEAIESYCGDGSQWGMSFSYQRQTEVSGTGSATRLAADFAGDDPFMLTYGDILLDAHEYMAVVTLFRQTGCSTASALNRIPEVAKGSAVYLEGNRIVKVIEKPPPGTSGTDLNNAGVFIFQPSIFDAIDHTPKSVRGEYELTEAVQTLITGGNDVRGHVISGQQYDIGTPEFYLETNLLLIDTFRAQDTERDHARILSDNYASPNIVIDQPVVIDRDCEFERCRLGPGVCMSRGVRIGHGVTIQHSVIMPGADIGDGASLAHTIIGHEASVSNRSVLHGSPEQVIVVGDKESE